VYNYTDALRWCQQVAEGMAYLHSCQPQVIHRDLKLENILLKGGWFISIEFRKQPISYRRHRV